MTAETRAAAARPPLRRRLVPVLGLLVLSPVAAEYLIGYAESIAHPWEMLAGLLILGPLYGSVAVLIREAARRTGRGRPTMLLLGAAFGLVQAGLIDQSLFNPAYGGDVDIPYWEAERLPTLIPALGVSANHVLDFVGGHMIWSFGAPIAVVEACAPRIAGRPWLGRAGVTVMVVLYLLAAALIFSDHVDTDGFVASAAQLTGAVVIAVVLAVAAFAIPRRPATSPGRVPPPWLVGCVALAALAVHSLTPSDWPGVAASGVALALAGGLLLAWSRRPRWGREHALSAAGAALVLYAALAFVVEPLGNPSSVAKYAANTVIAAGVLGLLAWAYRGVHRAKGGGDEPGQVGGAGAGGSMGADLP